MEKDLQQYFLKKEMLLEYKEKVLNKLVLTNFSSVIEIGYGKGDLTFSLIDDLSFRRYFLFEIDSKLETKFQYECMLKYFNPHKLDEFNRNRLNFFTEFKSEKYIDLFSDLNQSEDICLISNPAYNILDDILLFIEKVNIKNVVLMIPEKRKQEFLDLGYIEKIIFSAKDFEPESKGNHIIMQKGFDL